jgi:hypothetical protein
MLLSFRDEISALVSGVGKAFGCLFCEALYLYRAKNHLRLFFTQDFTKLLQPVSNVAVTLIFPDV